ncbi:MAG: flagellin [Succinivibrionaceae bacterium]|nr:flagellin [Succinivibrionaceae bacterium]
MSLYVNTNVSSLRSSRYLSGATVRLDRSYQKLSSGLRVNSARDDAAGLQIMNRMTAQINGLTQGNRNAMDGISMLQIAEGAIGSITDNLQRIRVLAVQSANGSYSDTERKALQEEVQTLSEEINRIAYETSFGGKKLLIGEHDFKFDSQNSSAGFKTLKATMIFPGGADHAAQGVIDKYHESQHVELQVGAYKDNVYGIDLALGYTGNLTHYDESGMYQCDYSAYGSNVKTQLALSLEGLYLAGLPNPNQNGTRIVEDSEPDTAHTTGFSYKNNQVALDVATAEASEKVIDYVDSFLKIVDSKRAEYGAAQNRLESSISNQENVIENVSDARSRIRDCDYAVETAKMALSSILQQGASTVLSQANMLPQTALSLLGAQ